MDWQRQLTTQVTEVITVVWELFLPDLTRGVPEAEHEDKRPDVSLLHLSYFVTLMVLYKPRISHTQAQTSRVESRDRAMFFFGTGWPQVTGEPSAPRCMFVTGHLEPGGGWMF